MGELRTSAGSLAGPGATRFVLALLVLCYHFTPLRSGNFAVCCFYILSGYWITKMWRSKYSKVNQPQLIFLVSRWLRIAPMLLLCTALILILPINRSGATPGWLLRQAIIIGCTGPYVPLAPAWSLDVELQFYLAFAICAPMLFSSKHPGRIILWLFAISLVISLGAAFVIGNLIKPLLWIWLPLFLAGMWLETASYNPSKKHIYSSIVLLTVALALCAFIPALLPLTWHIPRAKMSNEQLTFLTFRTPTDIVVSLLCIPVLGTNLTHKPTNIDTFLGRMSFPLYLWHWFPHTLLVLGMLNISGLAWFNTLVAMMTSLVGGALLTLVDMRTDRVRSQAISGLNQMLNK